MPLQVVLWHHGRMPKRSYKRNAETKGGGIVAAVTQDIELTVEQAEEAAKKAAHAAAAALRIASGGAPVVLKPSLKQPSSKQVPTKRPSTTVGPATPSRSSKAKRKP
jgi:hypothetical protein